jgi:cytoskeletal protein CcmA (bactofilin family)
MIGPSIVIKGTVSGDEDLLVQGRVEGSIELNSNEVSVGQSGRVTADINAKTVKIDGEVTGDISGGEKVVISKSGRVRGNIVAPRVTLEDGAIFKGSIDMDPGDSASTTVSLATQRGVDKPAEDLAGTPLEQKSG